MNNELYIKKLKEKFDINFDLTIINVKYLNFNNEIKEGTIVCNQKIKQDLIDIFKELLNNNYQIEQIRLIDEFNFNDDFSMFNNNSSCFNYRKILNTDNLSNHSYGLAIDINPLYNPYVVDDTKILPINGIKYANRRIDFKHKIDHTDLCYRLFIEHGFSWGGDWKYPDYQHFEKVKN